MPELPEVEAVCRVMRRILQGRKIKAAKFLPDDIILGNTPPEAFQHAIEGRAVTGIGRKGKYWWIEFAESPWLFGHLGMSGWVREIGQPGTKLKSHGDKAQEDADGNPKYLKMLIETDKGGKIAFVDPRRLGRLWLAEDAKKDARIKKLGFDALEEMPTAKDLHEKLKKRKAPLKAILLDQGLFAGVGNWIADEALYQSKLAPKRLGTSLTLKETEALRQSILSILKLAVEADADFEKYPKEWLFHHRWGGKAGIDAIEGKPIVREPVGGRTTAWVPTRQE